MTTTEDRPVVDLDAASLAVIVEAVVAAGYGSQKLVQRKLRLAWSACPDVLDELAGLGILGQSDVEGTWPTLVDAEQAGVILARLAEPVRAELAVEPVDGPGVDLVKHPADPGGGNDDEPGVDLAVRPDNDLVTRVRQATARGLVTVADQPVVQRGVAVSRQAPKAGVRLVIWTPRGAVRGVALGREWLFATRSAAMVGRLADQDHPDWHKSADQLGKLHDRLATRRLAVGAAAGVAVLVALAWWAPQVFAGVLAAVVGAGVLALARPVCRAPKELAVCALVAIGLGWLAWSYGTDLAGVIPRPPGWAWLVLAGIAVAGLGWLGRKEDQKLVEMPANMAPHKPPPITAPMIVEALFRIGVAGMTTTAADRGMRDEIRVRAPGVGRAKHGWQIELELPPGITAGDVGEKREELAGALRRPLGCVWPSGGGDHPGHLRIYLGDKPMATAPQTVWPLAVGHPIDLFEPFPMFTDEEGRWVDVTLLGTHAVVAGASGFGKSVSLRQLAVACALDPRAQVYVFDGKISGDLAPLQKIAHGYHEGAEPEDIAETLAALQGVEREMRRRARFLRTLPPEERSPKVTSALASKYRHLSPIALLVDEVQEYTEYGIKSSKEDKEIQQAFVASFTRISRLGRSAGITMVLVSQKPEASVIATAIMGNCSIRVCHKVTEQNHNDQVLGTSAYKNGYNAALFSQEDRGLAWLRAEGDPRVVRSWSAMVDLEPAIELVEKAWALRKARGLLTGQAADDGIEDAEIVYSIVEDVERVMSEHGCGKAQWGELVAWLRELRGQYAALTEEELSAGVRAAGVRVADVRSGGSVRKGVYISDLRKRGGEDDE